MRFRLPWRQDTRDGKAGRASGRPVLFRAGGACILRLACSQPGVSLWACGCAMPTLADGDPASGVSRPSWRYHNHPATTVAAPGASYRALCSSSRRRPQRMLPSLMLAFVERSPPQTGGLHRTNGDDGDDGDDVGGGGSADRPPPRSVSLLSAGMLSPGVAGAAQWGPACRNLSSTLAQYSARQAGVLGARSGGGGCSRGCWPNPQAGNNGYRCVVAANLVWRGYGRTRLST